MKTEEWIGKKGFRYWYYRFRDSEYYAFSIITATIVACIVLVFYVIVPELTNWFSIRNEVIATRARIAVLQQNITFLNSLDKATLDSQLQTATHALPPTKDFAAMLNAISSAAADSGVSLNDYSFQVGDIASSSARQVGAPANGLSSTTITVVVNGSIGGIRQFVKSLQNTLPLSETTIINGSNGSVSITLQFYQKPFPSVDLSGEAPLQPLSPDKVNLLQKLSSWDNSAALQNTPQLSGSSSAMPLF